MYWSDGGIKTALLYEHKTRVFTTLACRDGWVIIRLSAWSLERNLLRDVAAKLFLLEGFTIP